MNYYVTFILLGSLLQTVLGDASPVETFRELVCENEELVLTCHKGYTIDIRTAVYGKKNPLYCSMAGNKVNDCSAGNALDIVKFKCNRKERCTLLASNNVFGDPCYGIFKYLDVTYDCIAGDIQSKSACENEDLDIHCPDGTFLWISNAVYGRINPIICGGINTKAKSNRCISEKSLSVVESKCDNLQQCKVRASNQIFGDPCVGTFKYLEVDYQCLDSMGGRVSAIDVRTKVSTVSENETVFDQENLIFTEENH
uniref:Secreted Lectin-like protein n=1 Tax=Pristhesancus plagipennis TaxID=1955184 RepID=A0A2K8JWH6_PRIPG|nr:secreted Lectin-like protein [Pristhesancus plagipennis]